MLTDDGNEKCQKNPKKLCMCSTFFCTFLCHCFARLQRTRKFLVACFMEEKSHMFLHSSYFFTSLLLILTSLGTSISHFLIAALNFSCFFPSAMNFSFVFFFFFVFRSSPFSVIGVSVIVVGGNSRMHGHMITKFSHIYRLPFFLSHARELR